METLDAVDFLPRRSDDASLTAVSEMSKIRSEKREQRRRAATTRRRRVWRLVLGSVVLLVVAVVGAGVWMLGMPGRSHRGPLPPMTAEQERLEEELRRDLGVLADDIGERQLQEGHGLQRARLFLETSLGGMGYEVEQQPFDVRGRQVANLIVEVPGGDASSEIVVVGAHYDTVPGCPGANDNGTGVVATLALARRFRAAKPRRTLRFVLFVNEEPPYFQTEDMGSLVYAKRCLARGEKVVAMLTLETIGCYLDEKGSQKYPFPFSVLYPSTGNFIGFIGNVRSRSLVRRCVRSFRQNAAFPSEGAAVPGWVTGVGWSDHWAFWQAGYRGVMVTDTAPFRYAWYHTPLDRTEHVHFERLARVVDGLRAVVADLAE